ncbi:MAG: PilZ domain-containing protein [Beijerinckiaceae bacterium]
MKERRQSHRLRTFLGGQIVFNNRFCTIDCLVRNVSQDGAKLIVPSSLMVPGEFDLLIPKQGESRRARLIWGTDTELGVTFVPRQSAAFVSIETARRIKRLESDRDALTKRVAELSEPM